MDLNKISIGPNPPSEVNVVIEIPQGGAPIKYELDPSSGCLFVDRFLHTPVSYPANYGFVPHTLCSDGDPCDVLVVSQAPVTPLAVVPCRPIGGLAMLDGDHKVIAVPVERLNPYFVDVRSVADLPAIMHEQIAHFFNHYKDLEEGMTTRVSRWMELEETLDYIAAAITRYRQQPRNLDEDVCCSKEPDGPATNRYRI
jgi:inorganic pyrophosphatase